MCPYDINDPRLACQSMYASQDTSQTVTPRVRPKEVTDSWSERATEECKIRDDRSILIDPDGTRLSGQLVSLQGWIQNTRT